jgi:hypothetical protein
MSEHLAVTSASSAGASRLTLRALQTTHSCKNVSKVLSYCIRQQAAGGSFHRRLKLMLTHTLPNAQAHHGNDTCTAGSVYAGATGMGAPSGALRKSGTCSRFRVGTSFPKPSVYRPSIPIH